MENNTDFDSIVAMKKFIIEQLLNSPDANKEYRFCLDFLHNYKNENYKKFIVERTGKPASEVFKTASKFVKEVNSFIFQKLESMPRNYRAAILNEPQALDNFLETVQNKIKEESNELFIPRTICI